MKIINGIGFALALAASSAQAIPTLYFDGDISYDSSILNVSSVLTNTVDIAPAPNLTGSSLSFGATHTTTDTSNPFFTVGNFTGIAGDDITVIDGDSNILLTGEFSSLTLKGANTLSSGLITGTLSATGGSLASEFGLGNLIALEFNLSTTFSPYMFADTFNGEIDGRVEGQSVAVPEPSLLGLLGLGVVLVGFAGRAGKNIGYKA